jgi:hypothetical protein
VALSPLPPHNIVILEEGPLPRCEVCDIFVSHLALQNKHCDYEMCGREAELKKKRAIKEDSRRASEVVFTVKGVQIENVRGFIYLGPMLSSTDEDCQDVCKILVKARQR